MFILAFHLANPAEDALWRKVLLNISQILPKQKVYLSGFAELSVTVEF